MKVVLEKKAVKYLESLDANMRRRIKEALKNLEKEPPAGDIVKLQGQEIAYRLRIGGYRVLYKDKITYSRI